MADIQRHESVLALLHAHPGERDPVALIRKLAWRKIANAKSRGWSGPPFCPKEFCSLFDIRCREVSHDIGGDGRLLLHRGKLWVEYHSDRLPERKRFTIFHEFAHTLFPDYCDWVPLYQGAAPKDPHFEREFEGLCDVAAAEMLFPKEDFVRDLNADAFGIETCERLRARYDASLEATVRRAIELVEGVPCCAVFLTDVKGKHDGGGPLWVRSIRRTSCCRTFVWPGTIPPPESVAFKCLNGQDRATAFAETWTIKGRKFSFRVEASKLPVVRTVPDAPRVLALLLNS